MMVFQKVPYVEKVFLEVGPGGLPNIPDNFAFSQWHLVEPNRSQRTDLVSDLVGRFGPSISRVKFGDKWFSRQNPTGLKSLADISEIELFDKRRIIIHPVTIQDARLPKVDEIILSNVTNLRDAIRAQPDFLESIARKVGQLVKPGGRVVIAHFFNPYDPTMESIRALFENQGLRHVNQDSMYGLKSFARYLTRFRSTDAKIVWAANSFFNSMKKGNAKSFILEFRKS